MRPIPGVPQRIRWGARSCPDRALDPKKRLSTRLPPRSSTLSGDRLYVNQFYAKRLRDPRSVAEIRQVVITPPRGSKGVVASTGEHGSIHG